MTSISLVVALLFGDPVIADSAVSPGEFEGGVRLIREALDRDLFDYDTARFKDVSVTAAADGDRRSVLFCGEINARTRTGGYGGWQTVRGGVTWHVGDPWPNRAAVVYSRREDIAVESRDSDQQQRMDITIGSMACSAALAEAGDGAVIQTELIAP